MRSAAQPSTFRHSPVASLDRYAAPDTFHCHRCAASELSHAATCAVMLLAAAAAAALVPAAAAETAAAGANVALTATA